ncbi:conserved hypothetical protein [Burkholderia cenocepacia]|nr:conserved hypothetical protein [Burkholderia cenocepacia]
MRRDPRSRCGQRRTRGRVARRTGAVHRARHHRRSCDRARGRDDRRAVRRDRRARQPRVQLCRQRHPRDPQRLARRDGRQRRVGRDAREGRASAHGPARRRRDRELQLDLRTVRANRPLAVSDLEGRDPPAHAQHGDGSRARPHPRQLGIAGLDLVARDGRDDARRPREDRSRRRTVPPARARRRSVGSRAGRHVPVQRRGELRDRRRLRGGRRLCRDGPRTGGAGDSAARGVTVPRLPFMQPFRPSRGQPRTFP